MKAWQATNLSAVCLPTAQASSASSLQSPSGSDFQPSEECDGQPPSVAAKTPTRRRRKRRKLSGAGSDSSTAQADEDSSRGGPGSDFFLTAAEKRRRKAAGDRDAAAAREKSAAQRQREALEQLQNEKRQRMQVRGLHIYAAMHVYARCALDVYKPPSQADVIKAPNWCYKNLQVLKAFCLSNDTLPSMTPRC